MDVEVPNLKPQMWVTAPLLTNRWLGRLSSIGGGEAEHDEMKRVDVGLEEGGCSSSSGT